MKYIDLRNKELTTFPDNIDIDVEYLDLSSNSLSSLPDNLSSYQNLKILFISNNNFTKIPKILVIYWKYLQVFIFLYKFVFQN